MKFAFCNEMFLSQPRAQAFECCAQLGYRGVEVAPFTLADSRQEPSTRFDITEVPPKRIDELRKDADQAGLVVVGLHWLFAQTEGCHLTRPDTETTRRTIAYLHAVAECCAALGGHVLVLGSPVQRSMPAGVSRESADNIAAEILEAVMPRCESLGIVIALEPLGPSETNFVNSAAEALALIHRIDSPHCQLHLDMKAMATEVVSPATIIRECAGQFVHFHANDPNLLGPGMGELKLEPIAEAIVETAYEGWVSIEPFRYEPSPEEVARQSMQNLRVAFASVSKPPTIH